MLLRCCAHGLRYAPQQRHDDYADFRPRIAAAMRHTRTRSAYAAPRAAYAIAVEDAPPRYDMRSAIFRYYAPPRAPRRFYADDADTPVYFATPYA
jgi:hypothetical protein